MILKVPLTLFPTSTKQKIWRKRYWDDKIMYLFIMMKSQAIQIDKFKFYLISFSFWSTFIKIQVEHDLLDNWMI